MPQTYAVDRTSCNSATTQPVDELEAVRSTPNPLDRPLSSSTIENALIFEESPFLSTILQEAAWKTVRYSPQQINSGATPQLSHDLKHGRFQFLWIDMPQVGRQIPKDRMQSAMIQVCRWVQLACEAGIPACLFGAFGRAWLNEDIQALMQYHGMSKSYHRACHFGLRLNKGQPEPSKICFVLLSSPSVQSSPCKCNLPQVGHKMDWNHLTKTVARQARNQLQSRISAVVIQKLLNTSKKPADHRIHRDTPDCLIRASSTQKEVDNTDYVACTYCRVLMSSSQQQCYTCDEPRPPMGDTASSSSKLPQPPAPVPCSRGRENPTESPTQENES